MSGTKASQLLLGTTIVLTCLSLAHLRHAAGVNASVSARPAAIDSSPLNSGPIQVDRLDPSIDRIVPALATLDRVATGFKWVEGPVWVTDSLFFAEIPSNSIRKWMPGQGVSIFLQPSGYKGSAPYRGPEPGSNGMTLDARDRLTVAGHAQRDVYRFESLDPKAQITILADSYQGKQLNSPNDVVYKSDGSLYFTDPPYGFRTQSDTDPEKQLKVNGVYRIPHALEQKPGAPPARRELQLLITDLTRPNGIAFSPDEKYLYVADTGSTHKEHGPQHIRRFAIDASGIKLSGGEIFAKSTAGLFDGFRVDRNGRIWTSSAEGVHCYDSDGTLIGKIKVPEVVANVCFGGPKRNRLYICGTTSLYAIHLNARGAT